MPASDPAPNRSIWMRQGRACMTARDWAGAIRAYGQGLLEQPLLGMHYAANLKRALTHTQVVVAAAELSYNAAGRAFTLAQLYQHLGHPVALLGNHFPQWGRELWEPIRTAVLVELHDEELCNACKLEPITLDGLKRLWIWRSDLTTGSRRPSGRSKRREQPGKRGD